MGEIDTLARASRRFSQMGYPIKDGERLDHHLTRVAGLLQQKLGKQGVQAAYEAMRAALEGRWDDPAWVCARDALTVNLKNPIKKSTPNGSSGTCQRSPSSQLGGDVRVRRGRELPEPVQAPRVYVPLRPIELRGARADDPRQVVDGVPIVTTSGLARDDGPVAPLRTAADRGIPARTRTSAFNEPMIGGRLVDSSDAHTEPRDAGHPFLDILPVTDDRPWTGDALCAQTDPEVFFPEKGGSTREAKKVCAGCGVRLECLEYALANDERFGVWGGLSDQERRKLKKRSV